VCTVQRKESVVLESSHPAAPIVAGQAAFTVGSDVPRHKTSVHLAVTQGTGRIFKGIPRDRVTVRTTKGRSIGKLAVKGQRKAKLPVIQAGRPDLSDVGVPSSVLYVTEQATCGLTEPPMKPRAQRDLSIDVGVAVKTARRVGTAPRPMTVRAFVFQIGVRGESL
jgi:hypothetical protein